MSTIVVRKAELKDAEGIATIHVLSWQDTYRGQMPDEMLDSLKIDDRTVRWADILKDPEAQKSICIVAEHEGKIVGWASYGKSRDEDANQDTGELWAIYVHPGFLGKGAGSIMMSYAIKELNEMKFKQATLWVLTTNQKTIAWYEKKGWKSDKKTKIDKRGDFELHETRYVIKLP